VPRRAQAAKVARRARQAGHQRRDIIQAAARCFARAGFEATTMRAIADESGFTASSLYTYFESKDQIFAALVDEVEQRFLAVFEDPVPSGLDFRQRMELLMMRFLQATEEDRDALVFVSSMSRGGPCEEDLRFVRAFAGWIDRHSTKKDRGGHSSDDAAFYVWGVMHGFFIQWLSEGAGGKLGQKVPVIANLIFRGLSR
jgi:AcrR family transcriptional regulator